MFPLIFALLKQSSPLAQTTREFTVGGRCTFGKTRKTKRKPEKCRASAVIIVVEEPLKETTEMMRDIHVVLCSTMAWPETDAIA